ncbi:MAG TPA: DinB family protein [Terriglobales bacterium]|jgi:hypothetical protein|nr:DinB family protein [Terriglobales bacterium]
MTTEQDPAMTAEERAHVMRLLRESASEFLSLVEDVGEADWRWKPAPEQWSIGEAAEHIMMNEAFFFGVVQRTLASAPDPDWQAKTAGKSELLDRSQKAAAPMVDGG